MYSCYNKGIRKKKIMISKISSVENKRYAPNVEQNNVQPLAFGGLGEFILQGVQACERNPMLNVSVLDLSTAIVPRSVIETRQSNVYAGMEAFRREGSGLVVNCLLPGYIVMGIATLLENCGAFKSVKGMSKVLANEESLKLVEKYMNKATGSGQDKLNNALKLFINDLTGVDGSARKSFKDFDLDLDIRKLAKSSQNPTNFLKKPDKLFERAYKNIAQATHMTEHLELDGKVLSKNLKGLLEDFVNVHKVAEKNGVKSASELSKHIQKSIKLVNTKSLLGMLLIIPLAISMQPINRWITSKQSGVKGAPIYKDYGDEANQKDLTLQEKKDLLKQKVISIGSMLGVAFLSMGCKLPSKNMLQFKGVFPTMDQARIISTATFASRMAVAEDKNELREATIRDIATFSSLYFLGDYAAKGVATLIEKIRPDVKLLNKLKELPKDANAWKKLAHWVKDVSLKSSDEVLDKTARNMRSVCQLGNLAFSLLALGLFIPLYTRTQTNKKRENELKQLAMSINSTDGFLKDQIKNSSPAFKSFFR